MLINNIKNRPEIPGSELIVIQTLKYFFEQRKIYFKGRKEAKESFPTASSGIAYVNNSRLVS